MKFRLVEANGNDSFEAAQAHFDSLQTDEQKAEIQLIKNKFNELGFDKVKIEQLIPDEDSNMYFSMLQKEGGNNIDEFKNIIENTLKEFGAINIKFNQAINWDGNGYFHGPFYIEGMTLKENK